MSLKEYLSLDTTFGSLLILADNPFNFIRKAKVLNTTTFKHLIGACLTTTYFMYIFMIGLVLQETNVVGLYMDLSLRRKRFWTPPQHVFFYIASCSSWPIEWQISLAVTKKVSIPFCGILNVKSLFFKHVFIECHQGEQYRLMLDDRGHHPCLCRLVSF
jgi:hypothetical protein